MMAEDMDGPARDDVPTGGPVPGPVIKIRNEGHKTNGRDDL